MKNYLINKELMEAIHQTQKTGTNKGFSSTNKKNEDKSFFSPKNEKTSFFGSAILQPKLQIGQPDDPYEKEADRIADQVMRMPDTIVQRKCTACDQEEVQRKPLIQLKTSGNNKSQAAPSHVANKIAATRGSGNPLSKSVQHEMGSKMGVDFNGVKVHTNDTAVQLNQDLGARAFTVGNDIYFNKGQYNKDSREGKHLLAHELTHVVQQDDGGFSGESVQRQEANDRGGVGTTATGFPDQVLEWHSPTDMPLEARSYLNSIKEQGLPREPITRRFGAHVVYAGPRKLEVMVYRPTVIEVYGAKDSWWGRNISFSSRKGWLHWESNQAINRDYCYLVELLRYPPSDVNRMLSVLDENINTLIAFGISDMAGISGSAGSLKATDIWIVFESLIGMGGDLTGALATPNSSRIEPLLPDPFFQLNSNSYAEGLSANTRLKLWNQAVARFPARR